jgi:hypothetical protein
MEGIHVVKDLVQEGYWLVKLDLKDAYFSIPIRKDFRKFLQCKWENQIWEFTCLPFGISVVPLVFTKILKVPISFFFFFLEKWVFSQ